MRYTPCLAAAADSAAVDGCVAGSIASLVAGMGSAYTGNWSVAYGLRGTSEVGECGERVTDLRGPGS
jgi:hypothetical protein